MMMNLVREPLSAARAAPLRGQDAAERAAIASRRVRSTIAPRRRGSARAARVARASGARPAWKIAHRSRRVHTYALGAGRVGHDDGLRALGADVDAGLDLHAGEGGGGGHKSSHCVGSMGCVTEVYGCKNGDRRAPRGIRNRNLCNKVAKEPAKHSQIRVDR